MTCLIYDVYKVPYRSILSEIAMEHFNCLAFITIFVLVNSLFISVQTPLALLYRHFHSKDLMRHIAGVLNSERYKSAVEYFRNMKTQIVMRPLGVASKIPKPELVIAIVTVARKGSIGAGYLTQTVASIDKVLQADDKFDGKLLYVCNVDKRPDNHVEAVQLQSNVHFVKKYGMNSLGLRLGINKPVVNTGLVDKARITEIEDYIFCLNTSYALTGKYVLMLEDDVIPYSDVLSVIHFTLNNKLFGTFYGLSFRNLSNFAFLKLYYPLKWQGFAFETDRVLELVSLSVVTGSILSGILYHYISKRRRKSSRLLHILFVYGFILSLLMAILLGRITTEVWRRVSPQLYRLVKSSACCTQAMLYQRNVIPSLMEHLLVNNSLNKDLALYEFADKHSLPGMQVEPNLFVHTGLSTSLSKELKDPEEFLIGV